MKKKWVTRLGAALLAAALLAGCGSASGGAATTENNVAYYNYDAAATEESYGYDPYATADSIMENGLEPDLNTDRKMIYTANIRLESTNFDATRDALQNAVDKYGAYLEYTDMGGDAADGNRHLNYTVRVPVENYTAFKSAVGEAGSVLSMSENAQDITNSYIDVEARLDALEEQRNRLNALADLAETTSDLIEIESRLSEVQYQIESYTRQLRSMDNSVQYSTIDINLREVRTYTPHNPLYLERLGSAFTDGWAFFVDGLQDLSVSLVYMFPTLLLIGLIVVAVRLATRKARAERNAAREAAKAARQAAKENAEKGDGPKY